MRKLILPAILILLALSTIDCSKDDPPLFRIRNDRATKANVQLKTSGGNTININDVAAGQTTGFQEAAQGQIEATATIQNESVSPTVTFNATNNNSYTIVVTTANPPTLRVE